MPPLRLVMHDSNVYSLDNRRLCIAKVLSRTGWIKTVPAKILFAKPQQEWRRKFDSTSNGMRVKVRRTQWEVSHDGRGFPARGLEGGCPWATMPKRDPVKAQKARRRAKKQRRRQENNREEGGSKRGEKRRGLLKFDEDNVKDTMTKKT